MVWASCVLQTPMMMGQLLAERYVFPLELRRIIGLRSSLHTSLISKHGRRITQNQNQLQKKNLVQLATGQQTMEDFFRKREVFKFDNQRQIFITDCIVEDLIVDCGLPIYIVETKGFRRQLFKVEHKWTACFGKWISNK